MEKDNFEAEDSEEVFDMPSVTMSLRFGTTSDAASQAVDAIAQKLRKPGSARALENHKRIVACK